MIKIKKFIPLGIVAVFLVLTIQPVQAFGPYGTFYINEELKKEPAFQATEIGQKSIRHWDMFQACALISDISTVHYVLETYKYEATHNHNQPDAILADVGGSDERMEVCVYGIEIGHFVGDSIVHNQWIPKVIEQSSIPNIPIHPLTEAALEAKIIRDHPEIFEQGRGALDVVANDDAFLEKFQGYIRTSTGCGPQSNQECLDVKSTTKFFQDVLGSEDGFYSNMWTIPEMYKAVGYGYWSLGIALFLVIGGVAAFLISRARPAIIISILPFIFSVLMIFAGFMQPVDLITVSFFWITSLLLSWFFIRRKYSRILPLFWLGFIAVGAFLLTFGGLAGWVNISDADYYIQETINQQVITSQADGWPQRYKFDPTGFERIAVADAKVIFTDVLFISGIAALLLFLTWFFKWRKR
jgi:hypothetical protein